MAQAHESPLPPAAAIDDFLARETRGVGIYLDELNERSPFRADAPRTLGDAQASAGE